MVSDHERLNEMPIFISGWVGLAQRDTFLNLNIVKIPTNMKKKINITFPVGSYYPGDKLPIFWIGLPVFAITLRLSTINNVHYQNRITYGHTSQLFTVNPIWLPQYSLY